MVGRLYTSEDEIDVIHEDLGRARRRLHDLLAAKHEGREADHDEVQESIRQTMAKVRALEVELREARAAEIAAAEGFTS